MHKSILVGQEYGIWWPILMSGRSPHDKAWYLAHDAGSDVDFWVWAWVLLGIGAHVIAALRSSIETLLLLLLLLLNLRVLLSRDWSELLLNWLLLDVIEVAHGLVEHFRIGKRTVQVDGLSSVSDLVELGDDGSLQSWGNLELLPIGIWHLLELKNSVDKVVFEQAGELIEGVCLSSKLGGGDVGQEWSDLGLLIDGG